MTDVTTPNLGLVAPVDSSPMSDVTTYFNNNWAKIKAFAVAKPLTAVPDSYTAGYVPGDRIYVSGGTHPQGIYVCIGVDPDWGTFWRPVSAQYGPWFRPGAAGSPNSIIQDTTDFEIQDASNPFQYRLTREGEIQFRGCVFATTFALTWPDTATTGYSFGNVFKTIPECIRPAAPIMLQTSPYPLDSGATSYQSSYVYFDTASNKFIFQVHNASNTATRVFFSGSHYCIGNMGFSS